MNERGLGWVDVLPSERRVKTFGVRNVDNKRTQKSKTEKKITNGEAN